MNRFDEKFVVFVAVFDQPLRRILKNAVSNTVVSDDREMYLPRSLSKKIRRRVQQIGSGHEQNLPKNYYIL